MKTSPPNSPRKALSIRPRPPESKQALDRRLARETYRVNLKVLGLLELKGQPQLLPRLRQLWTQMEKCNPSVKPLTGASRHSVQMLSYRLAAYEWWTRPQRIGRSSMPSER
jgi:hypothetical protein